MPLESSGSDEPFLTSTRVWLERAVIGLNLCPFARSVYVRGLVRMVVSQARDDVALMKDLESELTLLRDTPAERVDTTVLIHPHVLQSFEDYNAFLGIADGILAGMRLRGIIQIASFHPGYVFADADPDDVTNGTNRSPYPTLHLLREASLAKVVAVHPDPSDIYEANKATMRRLGVSGLKRLLE
jgi:hypothetical protein